MNLATARSESRARGSWHPQKSIGSRRKELIAQFLGESLLITTLAFITAIVIIELALPYNQLVNKTTPDRIQQPLVMVRQFGHHRSYWCGFGLPCLVSVSIPASQSSQRKVHAGKQASTPRKVLVTLQFGLSIFLIIGTLVIYQQIQHVKNRTVGYERKT